MNTFVKLTTLMIAFFLSLNALNAQQQTPKTHFSLEIDPATFAFGGYSMHARVQPKSSQHLLAGVGIYAMDMPSMLVDLNPENKDAGWSVRINRGLGLFGEYHFKEVNRGFFVGGQASTQEFRIEQAEVSGSQKFNNGLLMGYGGYTVQPLAVPLYVKFWGGLGYTTKMSGDNRLGAKTYDIAPITMFATVHLGYTF